MKNETQKKLILHWLESGKTITQLQALQLFGCFRLSARILELKDEGHMIKNLWLVTLSSKKCARYKLITERL